MRHAASRRLVDNAWPGNALGHALRRRAKGYTSYASFSICCRKSMETRPVMDSPESIQQHLAAIVESSEDAIVTKDLNSIILSWNRGAENLFGYTAEEAIGRPITIIFPDDRMDEEVDFIARLRRGERIANYETVRQRKDGSPVPVSLTVSPVRDAEGHVVGASKIARDITLQHQLAEQQRLLLSEMRHRVGNAFAVAASLIAVAARQAESVEQLSSEMRCRLHAIASLNSMTVNDPSGDEAEGMPLSYLVSTILKPFSEGATVQTSLPDIQVRPAAITPLTLVLFELATNSVKYGGLSRDGHGLEINAEIEDGRFGLTWKEPGVTEAGSGKVESKGFGTSLCRLTVSTSLGGSFSREFTPEGLVATLDLDLAAVSEMS
ncbi:histidine kinase [Thioclava sp. NG1]|nr:histidine kinase [Thioclava sp. NG1]